ncbi:MAG TPA: DUF5668 domain-containing protein [Luteitalea sp.]|nr:DUF5668 domain-containing protein [Luteitalea sp.]
MSEQRRRSGRQALAGLLLLTVGGLLFAQNLELLNMRQYWQFWPVLPIGLGLLKVLLGATRGDKAFGILLIAFGGGQLARVLGYWSPGPADLVALSLIAMGGYFVVRGLFGRPPVDVKPDSMDWISGFAVMAGFERSNNSQTFRGGDITAVMGGCEIDLRHASMRTPASIDVFVMWGGVELRVPEDWTVELRGVPILAGFVDKTRQPALATEKRLVIRGMALMGGVEIKN